jgi:chemotaxis protein MotC
MLGLALVYTWGAAAQGRDDGLDRPKARGVQPFEIVRSLQSVQDQVVLGNAEAHVRLPKVIGQAGERLLSAASSDWSDAKNARAAAIYVLSGGQPRVGRKILAAGTLPEQETKLLRGAIAYAEGREEKAKQILSPIVASELASPLSGHIALTQAALVAKEDSGRAFQLLDQARILAPGTLVEEAALRREIFLADETGDSEKFAWLSSQYFRRFSKSVYADHFRRRFADSLAHFLLMGEAAQFARLDKLLSELDPGDQLRLYLKAAQSAILDGKISAARLAAERAARLSKEGSADEERSKLYGAAALILTNAPESGGAQLEGLDASRLTRRDAELREAAIAVARRICKGPEGSPSPTDAEPAQDPALPRDASNAGAAAAALIASAQRALSQTDAILKESAP